MQIKEKGDQFTKAEERASMDRFEEILDEEAKMTHTKFYKRVKASSRSKGPPQVVRDNHGNLL